LIHQHFLDRSPGKFARYCAPASPSAAAREGRKECLTLLNEPQAVPMGTVPRPLS
jgi:hypothetical protein